MSGGSSARSLPDSSLRQDTDLHLIEYQRISHCTETLFFFPPKKRGKRSRKEHYRVCNAAKPSKMPSGSSVRSLNRRSLESRNDSWKPKKSSSIDLQSLKHRHNTCISVHQEQEHFLVFFWKKKKSITVFQVKSRHQRCRVGVLSGHSIGGCWKAKNDK